MHLSTVQWFLIAATLVFQLSILFILLRRKARSSFPYFFGFVLFSAVTVPLELVLAPRVSATFYFYLFWSIAGISTILCFPVMHEVFVHILKPYSALVDLGKLLFRWAVAFLLLVSVVTALATSASDAARICAAINLLERSSQLMLCGLLLLFVLFEKRLGLSWRNPAICIVLGLGVNAAVALLRSFGEQNFPDWAYGFDVLGASVCVAIYGGWCASFALPQRAPRTFQDAPSRLILQRWNEALLASPLISRRGEVIAMTPVESFLPGVERTVERVMARKMMN